MQAEEPEAGAFVIISHRFVRGFLLFGNIISHASYAQAVEDDVGLDYPLCTSISRPYVTVNMRFSSFAN